MIDRQIGISAKWMVALILVLVLVQRAGVAQAQGEPVVRIVFFYEDTCSHCLAVIEEVLKPLQVEYGDQLQIKMVQYLDPTQPSGLDPVKYEMLLCAEEMFGVSAEERGIPTLIIGGQVLIGEDETRQQLPCLLDTCLAGEGTSWPDIPGLENVPVEGDGWPDLNFDPGGVGPETCDVEEPVCNPDPGVPLVWAAYFYQVGCQDCDRAKADIQYVQSKYRQFLFREFNIYESLDIAQWLAERAGREGELHTPAVFIGNDALVGQGEITPQSLEALLQKYASTGADRVWDEFDPEAAAPPGLPSLLTVAFAGLVDGLNPCAFATLIFFISYLTFMGRKGAAVLAVGAAFTLGVFLAYTGVGVGMWRLLSTLPFLTTLGRWVVGLTALLCGLLAVLSVRDYLKARKGQIGDMTLIMPEGLRWLSRVVIRRASGVRAFALVALPVGAIVSLLELACTGQIYLPTIVFVMSDPALQARAILLLLLYNLMFILPLVAAFALAYFGATSLQLGLFLHRHTATVKLGTALLFVAMAAWLTLTVVA